MRNIAISGWLAYVPFRISAARLQDLDVNLIDGAHDREDGLAEGRYSAAPLSTFALIEALPKLGDGFGVSWIAVMPTGAGSDRIVCRHEVDTVEKLHRTRIGIPSVGLELNLFEHMFDARGLPLKADYIELPNRASYLSAFVEGAIDAVMAPQPIRSQILARVPGTSLFEGDATQSHGGLYAPVVYRRSIWSPASLSAVHAEFTRAARVLSALDDLALRTSHPQSFEGIDAPAAEVRSTLRWPSMEESTSYLKATGAGSFEEHLQQVIDFRARRFGQERPSSNLIAGLAR